MTKGAGEKDGETRAVWQEFVACLKRGPFPADRLRPYHPLIKETLLSWLSARHDKANWNEWQSPSEVHHVGSQTHFLLPLTFGDQKSTYCFSFVVEEGRWYFQHVESITIRLDQIGPLPATVFPDISEPQKEWVREELRLSEQVHFFTRLAEEKGMPAALEWFTDGAGYVLAAQAWVPFVPVERAFVLYLCWEQANLRGGDVTLYRLDEREALVRVAPISFRLYHQTGLRQRVTWQDYRRLFDVVWQDRSAHAGWELEIDYEDDTTALLHFTR